MKISKKTLQKVLDSGKDLDLKDVKIAGMTFDDFKKKSEKIEKGYQKNLRVGSKQKSPDQIAKGKGKFAWIYSEDKSDMYFIDSYHRNVKSFALALKQLIKSYAQWIEHYSLKIEDVDMVGTVSFGDSKQKYEDKILTEAEIESIVLKNGVCKLKLERKTPDKDGRKHIQGWSAVYTMEGLDKEENGLKAMFQKQAQEQADRTGKKAVVTNLIGWRFEAEPKIPEVSKKAKKTKQL